MRGWIALGKGDLAGARALLDSVDPAGDHGLLAERALLAAKVENRAAAYDQVAAQAAIVLALEGDLAVSGAVVAEAYQARGVARMYQRDDAGAVEDLTHASRIAREAGAPRIEAMAFASLAMAHQRAGRAKAARAAYDDSITAAEAANDAAAVALARLNLGTLAWSEGDLAEAISAFEAAADLGRRVKRNSTVERALLNLAVVDLGLGRYARVGATLKNLTAMEAQMTPVGQAQLLGVRAELESRIGDVQRASGLFAETAACWRAIGRPGDAAEVEIDGVLLRCQRDTPSATGASSVRIDEEQRILDAAEADLGARAGELAAPLSLARGLVAPPPWRRAGRARRVRQGASHAAEGRQGLALAGVRRPRPRAQQPGQPRTRAPRRGPGGRRARGDRREALAGSARGVLGRAATPGAAAGARGDPAQHAGHHGARERDAVDAAFGHHGGHHGVGDHRAAHRDLGGVDPVRPPRRGSPRANPRGQP